MELYFWFFKMDGDNPPPRSLHSTSDISWEVEGVPPPKFPPRKKKKLARKKGLFNGSWWSKSPSNGLNSLGEGE